jgi:hypothetical protein
LTFFSVLWVSSFNAIEQAINSQFSISHGFDGLMLVLPAAAWLGMTTWQNWLLML